MKLELRPYQTLIRDFIKSKPRCNVWADCGLGKTAATLSALLPMLEHSPVLVIAPPRVVKEVWPSEIKRWSDFSHIKFVVLNDYGPKQRAIILHQKPKNNTIYLISYNLISWFSGIMKTKTWAWPIIVCDESSKLRSYRRNGGTLTARATAQLALKAYRFIGLTASPTTKGLENLWGQMWFVDGGRRLGATFSSFALRWFTQVVKHKTSNSQFHIVELEPKPEAQKEILDAISDVVLRVATKDWFNLNDPVHNVININLPEKLMHKYRKLEQQMYIELKQQNSKIDVKLIANSTTAKSVKCSQLANGTMYLDETKKDYVLVHEHKLEALEQLIDENEGSNVIVVYRYRSDRDLILKRIPGAVAFGGDGVSDIRTITEWNRGNIPVLVMHSAAGGHGLNLQHGGNVIIFYSHDYNTENYQQVMERIGPARQMAAGYDRPVFVHHIITKKTIDELAYATVTGDLKLQASILAHLAVINGIN